MSTCLLKNLHEKNMGKVNSTLVLTTLVPETATPEAGSKEKKNSVKTGVWAQNADFMVTMYNFNLFLTFLLLCGYLSQMHQ